MYLFGLSELSLFYRINIYKYSFKAGHIGGVMVSVLASSVVALEFEQRSVQTKH